MLLFTNVHLNRVIGQIKKIDDEMVWSPGDESLASAVVIPRGAAIHYSRNKVSVVKGDFAIILTFKDYKSQKSAVAFAREMLR